MATLKTGIGPISIGLAELDNPYNDNTEYGLLARFDQAQREDLPEGIPVDRMRKVKILDISVDGIVSSKSLVFYEEDDSQEIGAELTRSVPSLATRLILYNTPAEPLALQDTFLKAVCQSFAVGPSLLSPSATIRFDSFRFKGPLSPLESTFLDFEDGQRAKVVEEALPAAMRHDKKITVGTYPHLSILT